MQKRKVLFPGIYTKKEQEALDQFVYSAINMPAKKKICNRSEMRLYAKCWDQWNPLFNDDEYAKTTRYKRIISFPCYIEPLAIPMLSRDFGEPISPDYAYIGDGYDHEFEYFCPVFDDDEMTIQITGASYHDITPDEGSEIRGIILILQTEMHNQKKELVAKGILRWPEFRCQYLSDKDIPDPATMRPNILTGYQHPVHHYTDQDWQLIKSIWSRESIRGKTPRFWEDVQIGERLQTTEGPITVMDMIRMHGSDVVGGKHLKDYFAQGRGRFAKVKDLYYLDDFAHFTEHFGVRPQFYNTTGRNHLIRMVTNWCGDDGFVSKVGWRIVNSLPPEKQKNRFPKENWRPSFLLEVPELAEAGRFMNTHGLVPDCSISNGYVAEKYINNQEHFVRIICWSEDIDGNIFTEAEIVVKLPSRE